VSPPGAARAAAKAAISMQVLGIVGLTLDGAYWATSHGRVLPGYLAAIGVLTILLLVLLARRDRPSVALSTVTAFCNVAAVIVALWGAGEVLAREPRPWVPFQPQKLGVLALALIAPTPFWVGATCIAAFTLTAAAQYLAFPAEVRAYLAPGEPWGTFSFGAFALVALGHRIRLLRIEREAIRAHAEAEALKRLARVGLAVRDLSNTPLQTLRLSAALLRLRHPEEAARLDQMNRALDRLEQLERTFSKYEAQTEWQPGDESFDPLAVLEESSR
jgi:hypothetical protein